MAEKALKKAIEKANERVAWYAKAYPGHQDRHSKQFVESLVKTINHTHPLRCLTVTDRALIKAGSPDWVKKDKRFIRVFNW